MTYHKEINLEDFDVFSEAFAKGCIESKSKSQFITDFGQQSNFTQHHLDIIEWLKNHSETWTDGNDILRLYKNIKKRKDRTVKKRKREANNESNDKKETAQAETRDAVSCSSQYLTDCADCKLNLLFDHPAVNFIGKKLIIFDLNKVLLYRTPHRKSYKVRPFAQDFIHMASLLYRMAVWTSGSIKRCSRMVNALFQNTNKYSPLLFAWYNSDCEESGEKCGKYYQVLLKNLSQVWTSFPDYNVTNTVIVDDSPEKCAGNPQHTAIHPSPYLSRDEQDTELKPGGPLWLHVQRLGESESTVQDYLSVNTYHYVRPSSSGEGGGVTAVDDEENSDDSDA